MFAEPPAFSPGRAGPGLAPRVCATWRRPGLGAPGSQREATGLGGVRCVGLWGPALGVLAWPRVLPSGPGDPLGHGLLRCVVWARPGGEAGQRDPVSPCLQPGTPWPQPRGTRRPRPGALSREATLQPSCVSGRDEGGGDTSRPGGHSVPSLENGGEPQGTVSGCSRGGGGTIRAAGSRSHRDNAGVRRGARGPAPRQGFRPGSALHRGTPMGVTGRLGTSGPRKPVRPEAGWPAGPLDSADQLAGVWGTWADIFIQGSQGVPQPGRCQR